MARQEQQSQRAPGREMARQSSPQGSLARRSAGYPAALMLSPADFFRMSPFSLMRRMSQEMDRVLGDIGPDRADVVATVMAPIEVSQTDDKYVVRAELPGVNPADVKIEILGDALILEGERKAEVQENRGGIHLTERQYGTFRRVIPLPEGTKADEAKAKFENGMLEVTIPVEEQKEERRQIPIEQTTAAQSGGAGNAQAAQSGGAGNAQAAQSGDAGKAA
jgi:HSP20 family protein